MSGVGLVASTRGSVVAEGMSDGDGNWSIILPVQTEGSHSYTAVAVDPGVDDVAGLITVRAQTTIASVLDWLPESQRAASIGPNGSAVLVTFCSPSGGGGQYCPAVETGATPVVVRINFPLLAPNLFPVLELPLIGTVPPLPAAIVGVGVVLIPGQI